VIQRSKTLRHGVFAVMLGVGSFLAVPAASAHGGAMMAQGMTGTGSMPGASADPDNDGDGGGQAYGPGRCHMGPGMMQGYGMGPGMMGGYGMGSGMMDGYGMMQGYGMGPGMRGAYGRGPAMMWGLASPRVAQALGLSDDQVRKMNGILQDHEESMIRSAGDLRLDLFELQRQMASDKPDLDAVRKAYDKVATDRRKLFLDAVDARVKMRAVLTAEQRRRLESWGR